MTTPKRRKNNFIDNKEFYAAFVEFRGKVDEAKAKGLSRGDEGYPQVPRYIGKSFLDIAEHLSMRPNFSNYIYRQDMVMDAVIGEVPEFFIKDSMEWQLMDGFTIKKLLFVFCHVK